MPWSCLSYLHPPTPSSAPPKRFTFNDMDAAAIHEARNRANLYEVINPTMGWKEESMRERNEDIFLAMDNGMPARQPSV